VLPNSTIEATRHAMGSFRTPRMGTNLMAHRRSNVTVHFPRSLFAGLPAKPIDLETAALIVRGTTSNGRRFRVPSCASCRHARPISIRSRSASWI
jgi:hypothetical protein